jgi:TolB protein
MRWFFRFSVIFSFLVSRAVFAQDLPLIGLGHAGVRVTDIAETRKFYSSILGFEMPFDLMMAKAPQELMLQYYKTNDTQFLEIYPGLKADMNYRMTHVAFITDDLEKLRQMMLDRGLKPGPINAGRDGNKSFGVRPPPGQQLGFLEFTEYLPGSLHSNTIGKDVSDKRLSDHMQFAGIVVTDMDAAMQFYKTMGFTEIWRGPAEGPTKGEQVNMQLPGKSRDYIELIKKPLPISREEAGMVQHFGFATPGILVTYKSAVDAGAKTTGPPHVGPDGKMEFGILDPDGTLIEFRDGPPLQMKAAAHITSKVMIYDMATKTSRLLASLDGNYQAPAWSPDGKYLLMNTPSKLWRVPVDTGLPIAIDTGDVNGINNDHGISRDGKMLAVSAGNIYLLPAEGGEPHAVTSATPSYFHGFSPDGKWIAYCAQRDNNFDIYRVGSAGGVEERLTSDIGYDDGAEYSPDGRWIYFNSDRSGSWDIWRIPANGGGFNDSKAEQITNDSLEDWFPHLSPDGKWMVLISFPKGVPNHPPGKNVVLRIMLAPSSRAGAKAAKSHPEELVKLFGGQGTMNVNSWSPDSKKFAYVSYEMGN